MPTCAHNCNTFSFYFVLSDELQISLIYTNSSRDFLLVFYVLSAVNFSIIVYNTNKRTNCFLMRLLLGASKLSRLIKKHGSLVFEMYESKKYACRVALLNYTNREPIKI